MARAGLGALGNREESGQKNGWAKKWKKGKSEVEIGEGAVAEPAIDRIARDRLGGELVAGISQQIQGGQQIERLDETLGVCANSSTLMYPQDKRGARLVVFGLELVRSQAGPLTPVPSPPRISCSFGKLQEILGGEGE